MTQTSFTVPVADDPVLPAEVERPAPPVSTGRLGVRSGVGLVAANMIGAGVFLSAGFMAQDMGPGPILAAWAFGALLAFCGARTYAAVASFVPRSGGEYRYLSELLHPAAGYLAGWGSLLLGFAAPVAIDAYAVGAFLNTLTDGPDPRLTGAIIIGLLTLAHALRMSWSKWTQNVLVVVKSTLVVGFVALGLFAGSNAWPEWVAPKADPAAGFPWTAFLENQFWIAFAFSGWNAAVYAAGDFRNPKRDVPRAMMIGCGLVAVLYMLVNWVFVANLTPSQAAVVFEHESTRITLGHLVTSAIVGPGGARVMSAFAIIALISAMSAMTLVGPRVYAAMAQDGYLPSFLARTSGREDEVPVASIMLQGALSLALLFTYSVLQAVESASAVLMVFSGLVAVALFRVRFFRPDLPRPANSAMVAAGIYLVSVAWILWCGFSASPHLLLTVAMITVLALAGYGATRRWGRAR